MPGPAYPAVENYRCARVAEVTHALEGDGTFVEMARLQGNGPARLSEARSLVGSSVKTTEGRAIERIELA